MDRPLFEALVQQTPATVALHLILDRLLPPARLDQLFHQFAQAQYQKELLFSQLVDLTIDVVLREEPSIYSAFRKHAPHLSVSFKSVYNKLNAMELAISAALVHDSAIQAQSLLRSMGALEPSGLPGYRLRILDGNGLSATEHRIEELRTLWDAPLPGKVLAVLDPTTRLVTEVFLTPDGHASERTLLPEVLQVVAREDLWIADRNFCTHGFLHQIDEREAKFVLRRHGNVGGSNPGTWGDPQEGETGQVSEQSLTIEHEGVIKLFRHIRIQLIKPTRDDDSEIYLLSNLPESVSSVQIARLYQKRWTIERLFGEMSEVFACEPKSLCQPKAFEFVFCLGLVASNAVQVFQAGMRLVHGEALWNQVSLYYLMWEVHQSSRLVRSLVEEEEWQFRRGQPEEDWLAEWMRIGKELKVKEYQKAKTRTRQPPKKQMQRYHNGGHVSTHKILEQRKKKM
jgi:hypothetical protein